LSHRHLPIARALLISAGIAQSRTPSSHRQGPRGIHDPVTIVAGP
jgi:hypothetical protein